MKFCIATFFFVIMVLGCHRTTDLGEITIANSSIKKRQKKTHEQFIQIAYIDLFNKTIESQRLSWTKNTFDSQEDDDINYSLFIKKIIDEASTQIPSDSVMRRETNKFIEDSYLNFYGRYPNGYEKKSLVDIITNDKGMSVKKIYYVLMTSEEYRMF
jgi:hypothetical protein